MADMSLRLEAYAEEVCEVEDLKTLKVQRLVAVRITSNGVDCGSTTFLFEDGEPA